MDKSITAGQAFNPFTHFRLRLLGEAIIPAEILNVPGIRRPVARTYAVLAQMAGFDGACFPKIETVAELVSLSYRQVARHIKILISQGLLALRHQRRANGWFRNSEYFFLWHASFRVPQNVRWIKPKMSEHKGPENKAEKAGKTTNGKESQPRPADRGPEAAKPGKLSALAEKLQLLHAALPGGSRRSNGTATAKTASWAVHRASQAVGRKLTPDEVLAELTGQGFVNHMTNLIRRRKAPMTLSGICEYLYNWLAPSDRQTENYNPAAYMPSPKDERVLTAEWMEAA